MLCLIAAVLLGAMVTRNAVGDAIVITRAMSASTIAEIFIEDERVRVELEIGPQDLLAFQNLLPDKLYNRLSLPQADQAERRKTFFRKDWKIEPVNGPPIDGQVASLTVRKRIQRDEITGDPLPLQPEDAELVVYAELEFPLSDKPASLSIQPPDGSATGTKSANIGFVTYHKGLPVSDFRYLSAKETLDLDWHDPWYSRFRNKNLRRQYDSPLNVFLYVEPFEVRKEIVLRPVDLQRWVDLGVEINSTIPIADQPDLKQKVVEFLQDKHPVTIDGKQVEGEFDRIHFISRSLRKTGVVYPDEELPAVSATLGVIFVYPIDRLPRQVTLTWESFDDKIVRIPATATDEAGGLPASLTADDPVLTWNNYLKNPTIPAMRVVPPPVSRTQIQLPVVSLICISLAVVFCGKWFAAPSGRWSPLVATLVLLSIAFLTLPHARVAVGNPFSSPPQMANQQANQIMDSLLHNLYHAFDRRQESLVYDGLANSLSGDLLKDVYLQTQQQIQIADQGGMQVKIDEVRILDNEVLTSEHGGFTCRCQWTASGTVGHWGHLHRRMLGYTAEFEIRPVDDVWKITGMQVIDERQPETVVEGEL